MCKPCVARSPQCCARTAHGGDIFAATAKRGEGFMSVPQLRRLLTHKGWGFGGKTTKADLAAHYAAKAARAGTAATGDVAGTVIEEILALIDVPNAAAEAIAPAAAAPTATEATPAAAPARLSCQDPIRDLTVT